MYVHLVSNNECGGSSNAYDFIESLYPSQPVRDVVVSSTLLEGHIVQMERLVLRYQGGSEAGEDTGVQAS